MAFHKIAEYPACAWLTYTLAFDLYNALTGFAIANPETYHKNLNALLERLIASDDPMFCNQALSVRIECHLECGTYQLAEERIKQLPVSSFDQKKMLAKLY